MYFWHSFPSHLQPHANLVFVLSTILHFNIRKYKFRTRFCLQNSRLFKVSFILINLNNFIFVLKLSTLKTFKEERLLTNSGC